MHCAGAEPSIQASYFSLNSKPHPSNDSPCLPSIFSLFCKSVWTLSSVSSWRLDDTNGKDESQQLGAPTRATTPGDPPAVRALANVGQALTLDNMHEKCARMRRQASPRDSGAERYSLKRKLTVTEPDAETLELCFATAQGEGVPRIKQPLKRRQRQPLRLQRLIITPCNATDLKVDHTMAI